MFISEKKKSSIITQVMLMFLMIVVVTGMLTYVSQRKRADTVVREQIEYGAGKLSDEVKDSIRDYPAYSWLLEYWCDHADELDIEYDADYFQDTETAAKALELQKKYPDIMLKYATKYEIEKMTPEDQKKYAEVVYSWILTHLNEIKTTNRVDYMFVVRTKAPFDKQLFVISASNPGAVRGTEYEQVYPLGVEAEVSDYQKAGMKDAADHITHLSEAGHYLDYYEYLDRIGDNYYMVGLTYDYYGILNTIDTRTSETSLESMMYQILMMAVCLIGLFMLVLKPLRQVQLSIRSYKDTKDSDRVRGELSKINLNNEIGELAIDVSEMTKSIDSFVDEIQTITSEKEKIIAELDLASRIQHSMLPSEFPAFPEREEFEIYASMDAAREVGGDFYDFFLIDDDHLALVIADVSGKGIPAALVMMASKIIIQSVAMLGGDVKEILEKTNEAICSNNPAEMFVTVWVGILEISTGTLTAGNAGHEYPTFKTADGDFELYKDSHGMVLGGFDESEYSSYEIKLEPGSKVFVYTDGVPEATNADKEMFGTERMVEALNADNDADPKTILKNIRKSVDEFVQDAEQFDDLTMMCIEYKGNKA